MSTTRPLSTLLSHSNHLLEHARHLARLQKLLERELPADLSRHCRVQNLRGGILFIQTDGSAWANRLRYLLPALQQKLHLPGEALPLRDIQVAVVPVQAAPPVPKRPAKLTAATAQLLEESAAATDDPQLRAALQRLASRARRE